MLFFYRGFTGRTAVGIRGAMRGRGRGAAGARGAGVLRYGMIGAGFSGKKYPSEVYFFSSTS